LLNDGRGVIRSGWYSSVPVSGLDRRAVKDKQDQQQSKATREGGVIFSEQIEHAGRDQLC
jgi:hypothetical protein